MFYGDRLLDGVDEAWPDQSKSAEEAATNPSEDLPKRRKTFYEQEHVPDGGLALAVPLKNVTKVKGPIDAAALMSTLDHFKSKEQSNEMEAFNIAPESVQNLLDTFNKRNRSPSPVLKSEHSITGDNEMTLLTAPELRSSVEQSLVARANFSKIVFGSFGPYAEASNSFGGLLSDYHGFWGKNPLVDWEKAMSIIGRGQYGFVLKAFSSAETPLTGKEVAVKVIPQSPNCDDYYRDRTSFENNTCDLYFGERRPLNARYSFEVQNSFPNSPNEASPMFQSNSENETVVVQSDIPSNADVCPHFVRILTFGGNWSDQVIIQELVMDATSLASSFLKMDPRGLWPKMATRNEISSGKHDLSLTLQLGCALLYHAACGFGHRDLNVTNLAFSTNAEFYNSWHIFDHGSAAPVIGGNFNLNVVPSPFLYHSIYSFGILAIYLWGGQELVNDKELTLLKPAELKHKLATLRCSHPAMPAGVAEECDLLPPKTVQILLKSSNLRSAFGVHQSQTLGFTKGDHLTQDSIGCGNDLR
ncbi:hypothetical protein M427DRAFT_50180 [Gonapodya prolifera JEL478]|uniref:Protein kinase domain-containing protein n=1 Tax=Gonapodya prolifera (strain JEL478) TaxID=1344416 RepID=A0A138ZWV1_GONPJ|nr:hypothetical protein M427DRAFT_50180 [Gonapodya prolifera JEL478]|eukprot:KXS08934.1 hypothetical protein M427DRAFT_50180 [Gonapodya prolifera JEL478]